MVKRDCPSLREVFHGSWFCFCLPVAGRARSSFIVHYDHILAPRWAFSSLLVCGWSSTVLVGLLLVALIACQSLVPVELLLVSAIERERSLRNSAVCSK